MQRYLSADLIFPVTSAPVANGVLQVSTTGEMLAIYSAEEAVSMQFENIERFEGVLVPGFINTHCHLELSHLFECIPQKTGLPSFVLYAVAKDSNVRCIKNQR